MYPIRKDGHEFSQAENGASYRSPGGLELRVDFRSDTKLRLSPWSGRLTLHGSAGSIPIFLLSPEDRQGFVLDFFRRWKAVDPSAAKKAAFDYIDAQKGFAALAFVVCLIFCLPLAVALLADSREQFACTKVLREGSAVGEMAVTKAKKKRKGHYLLNLQFTAPDGTVIEGRDQLITADETKIPKSVPVVYSPTDPSCWSLTPNLAGTEVNWAKRRFFGYFTAMFGLFFLAVSLLGFGWAIGRRRFPRPYRSEISTLFQL